MMNNNSNNNKQVILWVSVTPQPDDNNSDMNMMQLYWNSFYDDSYAFKYFSFILFNVDKEIVFYYIAGIFCLAH